MKVFKKILFIVLIMVFVLSFVACGKSNNKGNTNGNENGNGNGNNPAIGTNLSPDKSITPLRSLTEYGSKQAYYEKGAVSFSGTTYAGADCSSQIEKLQAEIANKHEDVMNWDTDSSAVKIFAMSTPEGLLTRMAQAALTFEEMSKVVDYLAGWTETKPNIGSYLKEENGNKTEYRKLFKRRKRKLDGNVYRKDDAVARSSGQQQQPVQ